MKKLTLLFALAASFSLAGCEDKHEVVHETRVVHHYHSDENVNTPHTNSNDFEPVERPSTYSH